MKKKLKHKQRSNNISGEKCIATQLFYSSICTLNVLALSSKPPTKKEATVTFAAIHHRVVNNSVHALTYAPHAKTTRIAVVFGINLFSWLAINGKWQFPMDRRALYKQLTAGILNMYFFILRCVQMCNINHFRWAVEHGYLYTIISLVHFI